MVTNFIRGLPLLFVTGVLLVIGGLKISDDNNAIGWSLLSVGFVMLGSWLVTEVQLIKQTRLEDKRGNS